MGKIFIVLVVTIAGMALGGDGNEFTRTPLGASIDRASMKLLKEVYESSQDKNMVASPLGVLTLLSLYGAGSKGKIREEIMKFLGSNNYRQLSASYIALNERFLNMDRSYLSVANKVFVSNKYTLKKGFNEVARSYHSEVDSINLADVSTAANAMNEWSSKNTQGKINHPVSESDLNPAAAVVLLNVIFFQGHWLKSFQASETEDQDFYTSVGKSVKKPMMHLLEPLFYYEDKALNARIVDLPYKENKFRMVVVLPNEVEGLPEVLRKISEGGLLEDVFQLLSAEAEVDLYMPKFEIKSKHNLNNILPKVGVSGIFTRPASGIVLEQGLKVDNAFQEAIVKVDEEGATAGAFTGFVEVPKLERYPRPTPIPFKVDHPFLYAILYEDIVLFAGTYSA